MVSAGLLVPEIGGPSVRPYMPPRIGISNNTYKQDKETSYRRSLPHIGAHHSASHHAYLQCGRTPSMHRSQGSDHYPPAVLTLMNNVTFVESARQWAERILKRRTWQTKRNASLCLQGNPEPTALEQELALLKEDFLHHEEIFPNPQAVGQLLKVGEKQNDPKLPSATLAAYAMVASTIFNLDEAISN